MSDGDSGPGPEATVRLPQPSLWLGLVACAPLFLLYELGLAFGGPDVGRNGAEVTLGLALSPFGALEPHLRRVGVAVLLLWAWTRLRRSEESPRRAVGRTFVEGLVAALALGPLLIGLIGFFDAHGIAWDLPAGPSAAAPTLDRAARLVGAAVWEELLFRVAVYGLLYLLVVRTVHFLGLARPLAGWIADLVALLGSSVVFAAFHLALLQRWLGHGGEAFDTAVFLWRLLAGLLLAALFRWRGLGVCAWAHGLFNLALALGAGPGVFRSG